MKNIIVAVLVAILAIMPCTPAFSSEPICVLGGPTAMDTQRQLAEGESFVLTNRPLVVNLQFKPTKEHPERVGECMIPSGTKVAQKNGILQWVAACGNDEVNKNIFVIPFEAIQGKQGIKGEKGDRGEKGEKGDPGMPGQNYSSSQPAYQPEQPWQPAYQSAPHKSHHGWLIGGVIAVGVGVGVALATRGHSNGNANSGGNVNTGGAN